jgi:hypothetical protein
MMVAAIFLSAHFLAFASGFALVTVTREDLRATQIMLQRMEAVRVSGYNQLTNATYYPATVTQYYDEKGQTNARGVAYTVTHQIASGSGLTTALPPTYRSNVTEVTVGVSWTSGTTTRSRSMKTYVARYGLQNYVAGY